MNKNIAIYQHYKGCYTLFEYQGCLYEYQPDNGKLYYADNDEPYEIMGSEKISICNALNEAIKE